MEPPGGGKSNILDALMFAGYLGRLARLDKEYDGNFENVEPLALIVRAYKPDELFPFGELDKEPKITLQGDGLQPITLKASYQREEFSIEVKVGAQSFTCTMSGLTFPWPRRIENGCMDAAHRIPFEARLYGFDRYGLGSLRCADELSCGLIPRMTGQTATWNLPRSILSELGWNITKVAIMGRRVLHKINMTLHDELGLAIELKVLRDGRVAIFDNDVEVTGGSVPDAILRIVYVLLALRSSVNYAKKYGLNDRLIVMLEEPAAHMFPYMLRILAEELVEAARTVKIVVTTHNPLFVSALWDKMRDITTYYVYRERDGYTRAVEIDAERMAEKLATIEDILTLRPDEVVSEYSVKEQNGGD